MITPGMHTEHGVYAESPISALAQFESAIKGKKFLDLGCGKGFIVEKALSLGANAFGVEIEKELVAEAITPERVIQGDLFEVDLSRYEVLYYYLKGCKREAELFDKIVREFRGFMIIYNG